MTNERSDKGGSDPRVACQDPSKASDTGLVKGPTLEIFRLEPNPIYLDSLRIIEVKVTEAVGKSRGGQAAFLYNPSPVLQNFLDAPPLSG